MHFYYWIMHRQLLLMISVYRSQSEKEVALRVKTKLCIYHVWKLIKRLKKGRIYRQVLTFIISTQYLSIFILLTLCTINFKHILYYISNLVHIGIFILKNKKINYIVINFNLKENIIKQIFYLLYLGSTSLIMRWIRGHLMQPKCIFLFFLSIQTVPHYFISQNVQNVFKILWFLLQYMFNQYVTICYLESITREYFDRTYVI